MANPVGNNGLPVQNVADENARVGAPEQQEQASRVSAIFSNVLFSGVVALAALGGASLATDMTVYEVVSAGTDAVINHSGPVLGKVASVFVDYVWTPGVNMLSSMASWGARVFTMENISGAAGYGYNLVSGVVSSGYNMAAGFFTKSA